MWYKDLQFTEQHLGVYFSPTPFLILHTHNRTHTEDGFFSARSSDFTPLTVELVFDNTTTRLCFNLSIEDDGLYEFDEVINIVLSTDDPNVQLDPGFAEVTIADNES